MATQKRKGLAATIDERNPDLAERLREQLASLSEDDARLGLEIGLDLAELHARKAAGDSVADEELANAYAAAANLSTAAMVAVAGVVRGFVFDAFEHLIRSTIPLGATR